MSSQIVVWIRSTLRPASLNKLSFTSRGHRFFGIKIRKSLGVVFVYLVIVLNFIAQNFTFCIVCGNDNERDGNWKIHRFKWLRIIEVEDKRWYWSSKDCWKPWTEILIVLMNQYRKEKRRYYCRKCIVK